MSDIIDAAPPFTASSQRSVSEGNTKLTPAIPARDYVRLAQGFYFIFWGLLLTVLTGALLLMQPMPIEVPPFSELLLGIGVLATLIGSWRLHEVKNLGPTWNRRLRWTLVLAALMAYFCIFFFLWRRVPQSAYLLANTLAFTVTGIGYVIAFNRVVMTLALILGRKDMALESRVFGSGNVGLLLLPFACIVGYIVTMVVLKKGDPLLELRFLLGRANLLILILLLLPFSLTLSLAWSCKDAVLRRLGELDHSGGSPSDKL